MTCIAPDYATSDPAWTPLLPTRARDFTSFAAGVAQVEDARVYAGFHSRFSCADAATLGAGGPVRHRHPHAAPTLTMPAP